MSYTLPSRNTEWFENNGEKVLFIYRRRVSNWWELHLIFHYIIKFHFHFHFIGNFNMHFKCYVHTTPFRGVPRGLWTTQTCIGTQTPSSLKLPHLKSYAVPSSRSLPEFRSNISLNANNSMSSSELRNNKILFLLGGIKW